MENEWTDSQQFMSRTMHRYLPPVILTVLLVQLCSIGSNLIVGNRIGPDALAVMSAVNPLFFAFATMGSLICVGGSMMSAYHLGRTDTRSAQAAFTLSLVLLTAAGVFIAAAGLCFPNALMNLLGVPDSLREMVRAYLDIYLLGAPAMMGIYLPFNYLKLTGRQNAAVLVFGSMTVITVGLSLVLVGSGMGLRGAALASVAGNYAAYLSGLCLLLLGKRRVRLVSLRGRGGELARLLLMGAPAAINNFCNTLRVLFLNRILISSIGKLGLTVFSVIATITSLSIAITSGISQTLTPFVGVFNGEHDNASIRQSVRLTLKTGMLLIVLFSAAVIALRTQICVLFKSADPALLAIARPAIVLYALSLPLAMVNYLLIAVNHACRRTLLASVLTIIRGFAGVIGSALVLNLAAPAGAIWSCFLLAELLCMAVYAAIAAVKCRRSAQLSRVLLLDTTAEENGRFFAFSIPATDAAAAESAQRITGFCEENGLSPKTTMVIGLAIEEMVVLFNRHALEGCRDRYFSARILLAGEQAILRMRCGGRSFNPVAYQQSEADALDTDSLGIRMIRKLAESVNYTNTFGINNLTIVVRTGGK